MKKIYMAPSTELVEVKIMSMIAASPESISDDEAPEGSEGAPVNLGRSNSIWDDEE